MVQNGPRTSLTLLKIQLLPQASVASKKLNSHVEMAQTRLGFISWESSYRAHHIFQATQAQMWGQGLTQEHASGWVGFQARSQGVSRQVAGARETRWSTRAEGHRAGAPPMRSEEWHQEPTQGPTRRLRPTSKAARGHGGAGGTGRHATHEIRRKAVR